MAVSLILTRNVASPEHIGFINLNLGSEKPSAKRFGDGFFFTPGRKEVRSHHQYPVKFLVAL